MLQADCTAEEETNESTSSRFLPKRRSVMEGNDATQSPIRLAIEVHISTFHSQSKILDRSLFLPLPCIGIPQGAIAELVSGGERFKSSESSDSSWTRFSLHFSPVAFSSSMLRPGNEVLHDCLVVSCVLTNFSMAQVRVSIEAISVNVNLR